MDNQLLTNISSYKITINPRLNGFNIYSPVILYMNSNTTLLDLKKEFFKQIKIYQSDYIFDENNLINEIEIHGMINGVMKSNLHQLPNKTKIKDFECIHPYFSFYFPRIVQIKIDNQPNIFVFNADNYMSNVNKVFKKISIDLSKYSFNDNPIHFSSKICDIFNTYSVNVIKSVKIKNVENKENTFGSIYLIQTREFQSQNIPIYKIGKTGNDIRNRLGNYGKGGQVLFTMAVDINKLDFVELEIIKLLKSKFIQKVEIGTEYFEGDYKEIIDVLYKKINQ